MQESIDRTVRFLAATALAGTLSLGCFTRYHPRINGPNNMKLPAPVELRYNAVAHSHPYGARVYHCYDGNRNIFEVVGFGHSNIMVFFEGESGVEIGSIEDDGIIREGKPRPEPPVKTDDASFKCKIARDSIFTY